MLVGVVVLGGCVGLMYKNGRYEYCRFCGTDREALEYGLGPIALSRSTTTSPSHAFRELLDANHEHEWVSNCHTRWTLLVRSWRRQAEKGPFGQLKRDP